MLMKGTELAEPSATHCARIWLYSCKEQAAMAEYDMQRTGAAEMCLMPITHLSASLYVESNWTHD